MVIAGIALVIGTRGIILHIVSAVGRLGSWLAEQHTPMCWCDRLFVLTPLAGVIS